MNKIAITGNLTNDMKLSFTKGSGLAIGKFSIANNVGFGDKKTTNFINCVLFGKRAESMVNLLVKGTSVIIDGRLQTGSYEAQDGTKRYTTDILIDDIEITKYKNEKKNNIEQDMTPVSDEDIEF